MDFSSSLLISLMYQKKKNVSPSLCWMSDRLHRKEKKKKEKEQSVYYVVELMNEILLLVVYTQHDT